MANGNVDMWCLSVGLEQRGAVPTSTPGMNGKAWQLGEGKRAPQSAMSLEEKRRVCHKEINFLILLCVFQ